MSEYVLEVGKKGFDRLKFVNEVFGDHSKNFLTRAGLKEGKRILEIGCGTGSMTTWIAKQVGTKGHVTAIDASEKQIEIAKNAAERAGITNIEFVCSTIESLNLKNESIDFVYCRLLLMHLVDPKSILINIKKYLKVGGVIACEEPQSSSLITTPRNEQIERLNGLFIQLGKLQGFDFNIGENLLDMLSQSGYSDLHGCYVQPIISMDKAIEFIMMGAMEIYPVIIKSGLVNEKDANKIISDLKETKFNKESYYIFPRQVQAFGYNIGKE